MASLWLPVLCGALQLVSVSTGDSSEPSTWGSVVGAAAAVLAAAALVLRRRLPLAVLAAAAVGQVVQVLVAGPVFPVVTTVAAATVVHQVVRRSAPAARSTAALLVSLTAVVGSVAAIGEAALAAPYALLLLVGVLVALVAATRAVRTEAARQDLLHAERLRIARDLHDTVGHGVGAMTVQAGAGRLAVAAGATEEAVRAMLAVEQQGRAVLRDVRWTVGLLREGTERPGLTGLADLAGTARRSGLEVDLSTAGDLASPAADVAEAAYRIVQEAVTNVLRHAEGAAVRITVQVGEEVLVEVLDAGTPSQPHSGPGHGLRGMQERAVAVGGRLTAGPDPAGGWLVRARLPATGRR